MPIHREPAVPASNRLVLKTVSLTGALAFLASSYAGDVPDLPHAFDAGWQGERTCELLYETEAVRVGTCSFPPGVGHEKHFHNPHFGYVLEGGELRITGQNGAVEDVRTATGASWSTDGVTIHEALNIGDTTTRYLIVEPKK